MRSPVITTRLCHCDGSLWRAEPALSQRMVSSHRFDIEVNVRCACSSASGTIFSRLIKQRREVNGLEAWSMKFDSCYWPLTLVRQLADCKTPHDTGAPSGSYGALTSTEEALSLISQIDGEFKSLQARLSCQTMAMVTATEPAAPSHRLSTESIIRAVFDQMSRVALP